MKNEKDLVNRKIIELSNLNSLPLHGNVKARVTSAPIKTAIPKSDGSGTFDQVRAPLSILVDDRDYRLELTALSFEASDVIMQCKAGDEIMLHIGIQPCNRCKNSAIYRQVDVVTRYESFTPELKK